MRLFFAERILNEIQIKQQIKIEKARAENIRTSKIIVSILLTLLFVSAFGRSLIIIREMYKASRIVERHDNIDRDIYSPFHMRPQSTI